jgi:hypothetical protein
MFHKDHEHPVNDKGEFVLDALIQHILKGVDLHRGLFAVMSAKLYSKPSQTLSWVSNAGARRAERKFFT